MKRLLLAAFLVLVSACCDARLRRVLPSSHTNVPAVTLYPSSAVEYGPASSDPASEGDAGEDEYTEEVMTNVVIIGDSWMAGNNAIATQLAELTGYRYRSYARDGARVLVSQPTSIPEMWEVAMQDDPQIDTVLMSGGINDQLRRSEIRAACLEAGRPGPACQEELFAAILDALTALWSAMAGAGVRDVVYVQFSTGAEEFGFPAGNGDDVASRCAKVAGARCHLLRTSALVQRHPLVDGLHPPIDGYRSIAVALLEQLAAGGIAH